MVKRSMGYEVWKTVLGHNVLGVGLSAVLIIFITQCTYGPRQQLHIIFGQEEWHLVLRKSCSGTDPDLEQMKELLVGVTMVVDV